MVVGLPRRKSKNIEPTSLVADHTDGATFR